MRFSLANVKSIKKKSKTWAEEVRNSYKKKEAEFMFPAYRRVKNQLSLDCIIACNRIRLPFDCPG